MNPSALPCQSKTLVRHAATQLLDPQGRQLAAAVEWWTLSGLPGEWPVAVMGEGSPVLLLHGFDSSFLEFRRLAPLLAAHCRVIIPDLHGFGFSPRSSPLPMGPAAVLNHLEHLLEALRDHHGIHDAVGLIGASMGGAAGVELARRNPDRIRRLMLLAPAGLTGRPMPVPPPLDRLGVLFLGLPAVRRGLCRSAFARPATAVGNPELEIASLHLQTPGWGKSLAAFARSGGFGGSGLPLPTQPLEVLWGAQDRILRTPQKRAVLALLGERVQELQDCGHLPHLDQPETVAARWLADPTPAP